MFEIVFERLVHAGDHVADHLRRRVPDAQLFAQFGIEGFQERLVEVRHRLALVKSGEEGGPVHPVKRGRRPVQHLNQAERLQPTGIGKLLEQCPQYRSAQMPDRLVPIERSSAVAAGKQRSGVRLRIGACPQHPGGENSVEQSLHQSRVEKALALLTLKAHAESLFERRTDRIERRRVARHLDPREAISGIGCQQPSQVLRLGERRAVRERAAKVLAQARANFAGEGARFFQQAIECFRAVSQLEGLQLCRTACHVLAHQHEVARVRHQHKTVAGPVTAHLIAICG